MQQVKVICNPVISKSLSLIRDRNLPMEDFRNHADNLIASLLHDVVEIELLSKKPSDFGIVVILRSALAMLMPTLKLLPSAKVGFAGIKRDEKTAVPSEYYWNMPKDIYDKIILIPDPMFATGGSMSYVIKKLMEKNASKIRIISIVLAPEGVEAINKNFPDVKIYTAALDSHLDAKKFIVPGLGDFGDRYFGTE